jgi:N-sulfoglucosamine sulfohydrolase
MTNSVNLRRLTAVLSGLPLLISALALSLAQQAPARADAPATPETRRPNILLIVTDDQGAQMGALGTPGLVTPNMDQLAKEGTLFRRAFCAYPSCSPSRASMLTGTYPHTHRIRINVPEFFGPNPTADWVTKNEEGKNWHNLRVPDSVTTLPEALDAAGYFTGISHKFHIIPHSKFPFDEWIGGGPATIQEFITAAGDKPFFLMENTSAPHRPYKLHIKKSNKPIVSLTSIVLPPFLPDVPDVREDWAEGLTAVEAADDDVGATIAALRASGKYNNTIILFTGDHGPAFQRGKASVYPLGAFVPLIAVGPGIPHGVISEKLAGLVDLMPTILDYAGVARPASVQGVSLRPALEQRKGATTHDIIVSEKEGRPEPKSFKERGAFDGRYYYMRLDNLKSPRDLNADNFDPIPWGNLTYNATVAAKDSFPDQYRLMLEWKEGTQPESLFDLQKDPWGIKDVARDPAYRDALNRMRRALDRWQDQTGDNEMPRSAPQKDKP